MWIKAKNKEYGTNKQERQRKRAGQSGLRISMIIPPQWCPSQTPLQRTQNTAHTQIMGKPPTGQNAYLHTEIAEQIVISPETQTTLHIKAAVAKSNVRHCRNGKSIHANVLQRSRSCAFATLMHASLQLQGWRCM